MELPNLENTRWADGLDILVVAALVYVCLRWLLSRSARPLVLVILGFLALAAIAQVWDLEVTQRLLEVLFTAGLVAVVVIFQADVRRGFQKLMSRSRGGEEMPASSLFAAACQRMASTRTGALIAFRGREDWDGAIEGGIEMDAIPSDVLLLSLFNTNAPGHDGAVLVRDGRLRRFAAHLPLSRNHAEVGPGGTRHAAALGLSERCDAMIVVVSEERGTISVAENGRLEQVGGADELAGRLDGFLARVGGERSARRTGALLGRLATAAAALVLAVGIWFQFGFEPDSISVTHAATVELGNVPENIVLEQPVPQSVDVTLRGRQSGATELDPRRLAVTLDLTGLEPGVHELPITEEGVRGRGSLRLESAWPASVEVRAVAARRVERAVRPMFQGELPAHLERTSEPVVTPSTVAVVVRSDDADLPQSIETTPIDLGAVTESTSVPCEIVLAEGIRLAADEPRQVEVRIEVAPRNR